VTNSGYTALNDLDPTLTNLYKLSAGQTYTNLIYATDHLPIVADYTIPVPSAPTFTTSQVNEPCTNQSVGSITVTASGGSGSGYTYYLNSAFQPSNVFTGLAAGTYTILVKDGNGDTSTGQVVTITQPSAVTLSPPAGTLPGGTVGTAYSQTISASGGTPSYTYAVTAGSLAGSGLTLSSAGTLSGTPTAANSYSFTVTAMDANHCTSGAAYTLNVVCPTITLTGTLPGGTVNAAYNQTITALGGTAPYTYAVTAGSLPAGLTLSSGGVLSGTNTASGAYLFTVMATDTYFCTGSQAYSVTVQTQYASWLAYYNLTGALSGPNVSYTGDGMSNTNKFLAGFNPLSAAAYLHIISVAKSGANVTVTYLGASGDTNYVPGIVSRTNVLDFTTGDANGNYANGGWQDTGQTNILSGGNGSGTITSMTDTAIPGAPTNRYYRVRVLLP
jgi:hypothetical protein